MHPPSPKPDEDAVREDEAANRERHEVADEAILIMTAIGNIMGRHPPPAEHRFRQVLEERLAEMRARVRAAERTAADKRVAAAIEACAQIADEEADGHDLAEYWRGWENAAERIAKAIRALAQADAGRTNA